MRWWEMPGGSKADSTRSSVGHMKHRDIFHAYLVRRLFLPFVVVVLWIVFPLYRRVYVDVHRTMAHCMAVYHPTVVHCVVAFAGCCPSTHLHMLRHGLPMPSPLMHLQTEQVAGGSHLP